MAVLKIAVIGAVSLIAIGAHRLYPLPTEFCGEYRPEPVPPEPHRLVSAIDATLEEQVLDVAKR